MAYDGIFTWLHQHDIACLEYLTHTQGDQDQTELEALAKRSADSVIHFNPQLFDRYAVGKRRPYSLIFFLTAAHLQDKTSLGLRPLRKQFGLLAKVCLTSTHSVYIPIQERSMQAVRKAQHAGWG